MRVVEPRKFEHSKPLKRSVKPVFMLALVLVIGASAAGWYTFGRSTDDTPNQANQSVVAQEQPQEETPVSEPEVEQVINDPVPDPIPQLRTFAPNDFKIFYDQLLQPNLQPLENPPEISGNTIADARIREIAENRGYKLRSSPSVTLVSVDGYSVQAPVVAAWQSLKAAAAAQGHSISIVSAYRTVDRQRTLYLSRLAATGATIEQVADGLADTQVDSVLVTSSIPGYSKHHTGYTIDILCAGWAFENFKNSPCNTWITADNFKAAKEHGFIPSYPEGADQQGPDPEAWEFVWVGTDHLYQ